MQLKLQRFIAVVIFAGSVIATTIGTDDYFPFSTYPMYSERYTPSPNLTFRSVVAVWSDGTESILPVASRLFPFWRASLTEALLFRNEKEMNAVAIASPRFEKRLRATLNWYNRRVSANASEKTIEALRIYRFAIPWSIIVEAQSDRKKLSEVPFEYSKLQIEVRP